MPPLLAELGFPSVIHGLDSVSPKYGLTHRHINQALGLNVDLSVTEAVNRVEDQAIGWSYVDQNQYCKPLHDLVPLRNQVIKRTVLNTLETLIGPIRGVNSHSILGYVHKAYPPIYASLCEKAGFTSSLLIRGVEGGVVPSLRQKGLMISYYGGIEKDRVDINPKLLGIDSELRSISFPKKFENLKDKDLLAKYVIDLGCSKRINIGNVTSQTKNMAQKFLNAVTKSGKQKGGENNQITTTDVVNSINKMTPAKNNKFLEIMYVFCQEIDNNFTRISFGITRWN